MGRKNSFGELSTGAIVGIVLAVVVGLPVLIVLIGFLVGLSQATRVANQYESKYEGDLRRLGGVAGSGAVASLSPYYYP